MNLNDSYVICQVCGTSFAAISTTHLKKHNLTRRQYKEQFNNAPLFSRKIQLANRSDSNKRVAVKLGIENNTITNLTDDNIFELYKLINKKGKINPNIQKYIENRPKLKQYIEMRTDFINSGNIKERIYAIKNKITYLPICKYCGVNPVRFHNERVLYNTFCSNQCGSLSIDSLDKRKTTCIERYSANCFAQGQLALGVLDILNSADILYDLHVIQQKPISVIANQLQVVPSTLYTYYSKHGIDIIPLNISQGHYEIQEFLDILEVPYLSNYRKIIHPFEIDIYLHKHNIGIEYNGEYYHSEQAGRLRNYHLHKTELAIANNVRLLHIWEHEWLFKQDIVKSRIMSLMQLNTRIFARNCNIKYLDQSEVSILLDSWHIQGSVQSNIRIGLEYQGNIVAVMTLGKARYSSICEYELLRYASVLNTNVIGGASKLLSFFIKQYNPSSIISYADRRWGDGNVYAQMGFTRGTNTPPNFKIFNNKNVYKLMSRIAFQKHKLPQILPVFDNTLTAWQNLQNNGYNRVWDCGNATWMLDLTGNIQCSKN